MLLRALTPSKILVLLCETTLELLNKVLFLYFILPMLTPNIILHMENESRADLNQNGELNGTSTQPGAG